MASSQFDGSDYGSNSRHDSFQQSYEGEISLKPLLLTIWSYRRVSAAIISAILILFFIGALGVFLSQPTERQTSIEFQALFDGADKGQYPNGLPFSRADIISTPILTGVYEANDLKRYLSFDEFKNHIFILESNRELELLQLEYRAKLEDRGLTAVDRTRLEAEFRQKQEALRVPRYSLNFFNSNGTRQMPASLINKVLSNVLESWAEQAANQKGVLTYQIRVYSPNLLSKDFLESEDYIERLDIIRDNINRLIANVDELLKLPGATVIRAAENRISLPEIRANLEDIRQFRVEPLIATLRVTGITRDPSQLTRYMEGRLSKSKLDHQQALGRVRILQEALNIYMRERGSLTASDNRQAAANSQALANPTTMIPQLSESFLDRLIAISSQNGDIQYRQRLTDEIIAAGQTAVTIERDASYYEDLVSSLRRSPTLTRSTADRAAIASIEKRYDDIYSAVLRAVDEIQAAYKELSRQNLNPRTSLYTITGPYTISAQRGLSLRTIILYALFTLLVSSLIVPLGCIVHHYFKREILPQPAEVPFHTEVRTERAKTQTGA